MKNKELANNTQRVVIEECVAATRKTKERDQKNKLFSGEPAKTKTGIKRDN
ncbi:hypothetical protein YC2023_101677 [Brassica napus]